MKYTAKIYSNGTEVATQNGDDIESLQRWMLSQAHGEFGDIQGELINNETKEIVRRFRRSLSE